MVALGEYNREQAMHLKQQQTDMNIRDEQAQKKPNPSSNQQGTTY